MNLGWLLGIAFAVSLIWVWAMVDLHRREDLSNDHSTMWFSFLLVGSLLAGFIYLIWRIVGLVLKATRRAG